MRDECRCTGMQNTRSLIGCETVRETYYKFLKTHYHKIFGFFSYIKRTYLGAKAVLNVIFNSSR
jgi:hypothetical protein